MIERTIKIGDLFKAIEIYKNINFSPFQEEEMDFDIQIQNENNEWVDILYAITKYDDGITIECNDKKIECARKHKICKDKFNCIFADELSVGDILVDADDNENQITNIYSNNETIFYDLMVNSNTHLYQTSNKIIHHNTEICKVLSKILNIPLVRFDMSEYMEEHSVSKLLGAPPGYKGFGDGKSGNGLLINAIDEHPSCILLLDEIEKANSKIHNVLLQVMDNGKLTSASGKSVSFEHVYLIMTSNVGSYNSHKIRIGFGNDDYTPSDQDYEDRFLPEFRNRIDSTITFNNLSSDVLKTICIKFLDELKSILSKKMIDFEYNDDIINYIVKKVENSNNGARPMKHIITNEIKNVIAKDIVFGKYKNGGKILLKIKDNKIYFGE